MTDTSPGALRVLIEAQRRMSPAEKFGLIVKYSALMLRMQKEQELRAGGTEREVLLRLASRHMPASLAKRVYG